MTETERDRDRQTDRQRQTERQRQRQTDRQRQTEGQRQRQRQRDRQRQTERHRQRQRQRQGQTKRETETVTETEREEIEKGSLGNSYSVVRPSCLGLFLCVILSQLRLTVHWPVAFAVFAVLVLNYAAFIRYE